MKRFLGLSLLVGLLGLASTVTAQVRTWEYGELTLQRNVSRDVATFQWLDDPGVQEFAQSTGELCERLVMVYGAPPIDVQWCISGFSSSTQVLPVLDLLGAFGWELSAMHRFDAADRTSFTFYYLRRPID